MWSNNPIGRFDGIIIHIGINVTKRKRRKASRVLPIIKIFIAVTK